MSDEQNEPVERNDDWEDIKSRCEVVGIKYEERPLTLRVTNPDEPKRRQMLRTLHFPAGESTRRVVIFDADLKDFRATEFEAYVFLGDYSAIWNKQTGVIEAGLTSDYPFSQVVRLLRNVSNFEDLDSAASSENSDGGRDVDEAVIGVTDLAGRPRPSTNWRISLTEGSASIELSPSSNIFSQIIENPTRSSAMTMKLSGVSCRGHDNALQLLQDIGNGLTFELDVRNNIQLALARVRTRMPLRAKAVDQLPTRFPAATYPQEPLELYQYGRSATGLPLLQFLAYYQVVEFFFPIYSRQEQTRRLRVALKHPRFDVNNDIAINRVLSTIFPQGRTGISEREQLHLTLRGCLEPGTIREFINSSPEFITHFTGKSQVIQGAGRILLYDGQPDLRDQAADRIYAIRCRVVHTKQDGADAAVDLLLPSSPEARSMGPDVEIMRLVAQHVIAAAGETTHLS